jgi:RNA polymerase sigma-70 factor (ECF subfamily)
MTDEQLKKQLQALETGDKTAFSAIYTELKTPVYTVLVRLTGDRALAEDLLQEVFLKLYRQPPRAEKPRAYVFRMARNLAIDALRQRQPTESLEELSVQTDSDLKLDLEQAISRLTVEERQLVALHLSAGLTFREVAAIVERPLGTVLWQYRRAIEKLRILLDGGSL